MKWTKFKDLPIGTIFKFSGEIEFPYSGIAHGPWIKTGSRTYSHIDGDYRGVKSFKVGSINAQTRPEGSKNSPRRTVAKRKANPRGSVIYKSITRIEGTKGRDSHYPGQKFYHNFKRPYPEMVGLPDGSLLIRSRK